MNCVWPMAPAQDPVMRSGVISPRSRICRAAGASSCGRQPSKGPAEIRGSGQSKAPGCLDTSGDANPWSNSDLRLARALLKGERRLIQRQAVMPLADSKRLTEPTRPRTELSYVIEPAPGPHHLKTRRRLNCPDQDCAAGLVTATDEIQAPVDPVRAIDIRVPSRTKHRGIAGRPPTEAVRGWVFTIIGLRLDDHAADAVDQHRRANEIARHLRGAASKVGARQHSCVREPQLAAPVIQL